MIMPILAAVEPDITTYLGAFVSQIPWATPLLLWILDLRKRNQVLEAELRRSNQKIQDDVIPLLTRLADLIPQLLSRLTK